MHLLGVNLTVFSVVSVCETERLQYFCGLYQLRMICRFFLMIHKQFVVLFPL